MDKVYESNDAQKCCGTCYWYNGIIGDGIQFCDDKEVEVRDTDWCYRYRFCDKSVME